MSIVYHEKTKTFHLYNNSMSYIMTVMKNGHLGHGLITTDSTAGYAPEHAKLCTDFESRIYVLKAIDSMEGKSS